MTFYIQIKRKYADFSRVHSVSGMETIAEFVQWASNYLNDEDSPLPSGLHHEFFLRRQRIEPRDDNVRLILKGGETVIAKAFDGDGNEYHFFDHPWDASLKWYVQHYAKK